MPFIFKAKESTTSELAKGLNIGGQAFLQSYQTGMKLQAHKFKAAGVKNVKLNSLRWQMLTELRVMTLGIQTLLKK